MANQRFHAPKALSEGAQLNRFENDSGSLKRAHVKRNHASKTALLPRGKQMLWMRRRARVVNLVDPGMLFEKCGDVRPMWRVTVAEVIAVQDELG